MQIAHSQAPSYATATTGTDRATPPPFSPFSSYSSDRSNSALATSDDAPDLGAFTEVFRELDGFRPHRTNGLDNVPRTAFDLTPNSSMAALRSDDELSNSRTFNLPHRVEDEDALAQARSELEDEPLLSPTQTGNAVDWAASRYIRHPIRPMPRSRFATEPVVATTSMTTQDSFPSNNGSTTTQDTFPATSIYDLLLTPYNASHALTSYNYSPSGQTTAQPTRTLFEALSLSARTPRRRSPVNEDDEVRQKAGDPKRHGGFATESEDTDDVDLSTSDVPNISVEHPNQEDSPMFDMEGDESQLTLGSLEAAFAYLAEERERVAARYANTRSSTWVPQDSAKHKEPRKKRRRRKPSRAPNVLDSAQLDGSLRAPVDGESSSSLDPGSSMDAASPVEILRRGGPDIITVLTSGPRNRKERRRAQQQERQHVQVVLPHAQALALANTIHENRPPTRLAHSRSTPSLRPVVTIALDPRILQLRTLAHKLRLLFPKDAKYLTHISTLTATNGQDAINPQGPPPGPNDPLIHVFIDHSNILIGLLNYAKRRHHIAPGRKKYISHAALALILERGRPITRRVLATSSPLYQPMGHAEAIGYEVRVYARVPDTGDGADRQKQSRPPHARRGSTAAQSGPDSQSTSDVATGNATGTTASGPNTPATTSSAAQAIPMRKKHRHTQSYNGNSGGTSSQPSSVPGSGPAGMIAGSPGTAGMVATPGGRIKYREQGVDELLQLKLHQALVAAEDPPPPGATIVLATGDGNVGQFNEEGFTGCVRTALRKGWNVELYAWEEGLSRGWKREFGEPWGVDGRFKIVGLEKFAVDLVEAPDQSPQ